MAEHESLLHPTRASQPRSHDSSFRDTVDSINAAVQRSLLAGKKYEKVKVIRIRWSNDDMGLQGITDELLQAFSDVYNFPTQTYTIPHNDPNYGFNTADRISNVAQGINGSENLLIVIYEGHASRSQTDPESLLI